MYLLLDVKINYILVKKKEFANKFIKKVKALITKSFCKLSIN